MGYTLYMMNNTEMDFTTSILAGYQDAVVSMLEKIIRRGSKKGLDGMLSYSISAPYEVKVGKIYVNKVDVSVSGTVPKINGWEFVGKLTHDAGNFVAVMAAPGKSIPVQYRNSKGHCDHCHKTRYRKDTFVIVKDGTYREIGRGCLKDFFPSINVELVVNWFNYIHTMSQSLGSEFSGPRIRPTVSLKTALMISNAVIRQHGWMSKSTAQKINETRAGNSVFPTVNEIDRQVRVMIGLAKANKDFKPVEIVDADEAIAKKTIDFVRTAVKGHSDYEYNLQNFFRDDEVALRFLSFVASAIPMYMRSLEKAAEKKIKQVSNYVGTLGAKITADVEVIASKSVQSDFGSSLLVRMVDAFGNTFTTFTTNQKFQPEIGEKFKIVGTVKKHDVWNEMKSTMLTRVKSVL